jgi:hypothetical protein
MTMYKVTYSYYGKYHNEKTFETYQQAKGFFYAMMKKSGVTKSELVVS